MKDLTKIRESFLTEEDLAPKTLSVPLFYPQAKRKERVIMKDSKVNNRDTFSDQVCGALFPVVYSLNHGKNILPNSPEHRILKDLLIKCNT